MLAVLALVGTPEALACGGFACNASRPVLQDAERIVFGIDGNDVEMHVQITYEGDAADFAWVVPVPANPELFLTSGALFPRIAFATQPRFDLNLVDEGLCRDAPQLGMGFSQESSFIGDSAPRAEDSDTGVTVVGEQAVGPYDTVTLAAETSDALLGWLADNGYDLPPAIEGALAPYVAEDAFFVALKLRKDKDAGDLAPLGLRYTSDKGVIPVRLTSISATPDMRVEAYVLADTRAVPESYLHVRINEAAVDWWSAGSNYADVVTQAANEAGGHAFATDYYGTSDIVRPIWNEADFDEDALRGAGDAAAWIEAMRPAIGAVPPELFVYLEDAFDLPVGGGLNLYSCPSCQDVPGFDADAATDGLLAAVIDPLRTAQRMIDRHPKLSRMTSSLDAIEMTVDPVFVLNPDMGDIEVPRRHSADLVYACGNGRARDAAPRRLELADGRQIALPSERWFATASQTPFEYIAEHGEIGAQVIEQTGSSGLPEILVDHTSALAELARLDAGLGCRSTGLGGVGVATGLLGLMFARRRPRSASAERA